MSDSSNTTSARADAVLVRLAVSAYLSRYTDASRQHSHSDLRAYLTWCDHHDLDPLTAKRVEVERYLRWLQEVRRFKPSTVSRRMSVLCGFYRTCVIDGVLEHSPAEYVRRPVVPAESPTLGLSHLQFESLLSAARESPNMFDFALDAMLGLLGLRIFEACGRRTGARAVAEPARLGGGHRSGGIRVGVRVAPPTSPCRGRATR
jgi:integrase/recombinase XerD